MKLIAGQVDQTLGSISIFGKPPKSEDGPKIFFCTQDLALFEELSPE
jgi:ABC-type multidrug transport system ATPase subunit